MLEIVRFDGSNNAGIIERYAPFTYRSYREVLCSPERAQKARLLAFGAKVNGEPAGLILAKVWAQPEHIQLLSVFVEGRFRNRGIAGRLMDCVREACAEKGISRIVANYYAHGKDLPAFERLLAKCGFSKPEVQSRYYRFEVGRVDMDRWLSRIHVPPGYRVLPWGEEAREMLKGHDFSGESEYMEYYNPLLEHVSFVPECSFVLARGNEPVGWSMVEKNVPDVLVYRTLYIREPWRDSGLAPILIASTVGSRFKRKERYCVIQIAETNARMHKFIRKFVLPMDPLVTEYRRSQWILDADSEKNGTGSGI